MLQKLIQEARQQFEERVERGMNLDDMLAFLRSRMEKAYEAGAREGSERAVDYIEKNCDPQMGIASHVLEEARSAYKDN